jgi:hypothetical protein
LKPGDVVPLDTRAVRVIRVEAAEAYGPGCARVTARELAPRRFFVSFIAEADGRSRGGVMSGPYAHSFQCNDSDGLEVA